MLVRRITQHYAEANILPIAFINQVYVHTSELCYRGFESSKRNIYKEGHSCCAF